MSKINLLYEKTNNVNNASDQREIRLGNRTFIRDEKALPQSANGLRYAASLTRAKNLGGNHFIFSKIGGDGIYYWDNRKYNEERTKLQLGYQYQDIVKSFRLLPTVEFEWYSGHFYNRKYGLLTQYSQWLSSHWQVNLSLARYWRYYVNKHHANSYNGTQNQATLILAWNPMPELVIYGGGDWSRQYARDRQESYIRKGLQLGVSYEWQEKIGFSLFAPSCNHKWRKSFVPPFLCSFRLACYSKGLGDLFLIGPITVLPRDQCGVLQRKKRGCHLPVVSGIYGLVPYNPNPPDSKQCPQQQKDRKTGFEKCLLSWLHALCPLSPEPPRPVPGRPTRRG